MGVKKLLIIELNEFNHEVVYKISKKYNLKNLLFFLNQKKTKTLCEDEIEHHGLDPWVQWVSIHTGKSSSIHKVKRLGSVPNLRFPQIWETLSDKNITSGVWGAMNAIRNNCHNCLFFVPDPWTFSEKAYPSFLNYFLDLPRYYSKNYLSPSILKLFFKSIKLFILLFNPLIFHDLISSLLRGVFFILRNGISNSSFFVLYDLISVSIFVSLKKKYDTSFNIIFLNSLAHIQHHHWDNKNESKKIVSCLKVLNYSIGKILKSCEKTDGLILLNGLGQKNVYRQGYCIYRQKKTSKFLKRLKIKYLRVEEGMTNDVHIFFGNSKDLIFAYELLKNCKLEDKKFFHVELDKNNTNKIFYQIDYFNSIKKDSFLKFHDEKINFFEYFSLLRERTGSHVPRGELFSKNINIPKNIDNFDLNKYIYSFFYN